MSSRREKKHPFLKSFEALAVIYHVMAAASPVLADHEKTHGKTTAVSSNNLLRPPGLTGLGEMHFTFAEPSSSKHQKDVDNGDLGEFYRSFWETFV